jgi:hypothetical protein
MSAYITTTVSTTYSASSRVYALRAIGTSHPRRLHLRWRGEDCSRSHRVGRGRRPCRRRCLAFLWHRGRGRKLWQIARSGTSVGLPFCLLWSRRIERCWMEEGKARSKMTKVLWAFSEREARPCPKTARAVFACGISSSFHSYLFTFDPSA